MGEKLIEPAPLATISPPLYWVLMRARRTGLSAMAARMRSQLRLRLRQQQPRASRKAVPSWTNKAQAMRWRSNASSRLLWGSSGSSPPRAAPGIPLQPGQFAFCKGHFQHLMVVVVASASVTAAAARRCSAPSAGLWARWR